MTTPLVQAIARAIERDIDTVPMVDASRAHIRRIRAEMLTQAALTAITEAGYAIVKPDELADAIVENLKGKVGE